MMLFKDHYFVYLVLPNMLTWFNVIKTHYFSNTLHYCKSCMPRLSQTLSFLQSSDGSVRVSVPFGSRTNSKWK